MQQQPLAFGLMMIFTYYLQAGQCLAGAGHLFLATNGEAPWFNGPMVLVNGFLFCFIANWRAKKIASRVSKS